MKNLDEILNELGKEQKSDLTSLEKRRIYTNTMDKIHKEIKSGSPEQKKKHHWKKTTKILAAAAATFCVVCTLSITAVAAFGLDNNIRNYFHVQDKTSEKQIHNLVTEENAASTSHGVTLSLSQVIGDKTRFLAVVKASGLPNEVNNTLEFENSNIAVSGTNPKLLGSTLDTKMGGIEKNKTTFSILASNLNEQGEPIDINGKEITLTLSNLGYKNNNGKFVSLVKGKWKLNWELHTKAHERVIPVNKSISVMDSQATWEDISITPLSLTVHFKVTKQGKEHFSETEWNTYEKSNRVIIDFTDGSCIDSRFVDDLDDEWQGTSGTSYKTIGFNKFIQEKDIASVTFGSKKWDITKLKNPVNRVCITSKAANCSIALPSTIQSMISTKEYYNKKNTDFNCKENYTIFWATKNNVKMPLFTIHKLNTSLSSKELEKMNPMMTFIDIHNNCTYALEYGEIQSEEQMKEFADIMNHDIANILPFFEFTK